MGTDDTEREDAEREGEPLEGELEAIDDETATYHPPETGRRNAAKLLTLAGGAAAIGSFSVTLLTGISDGGLASTTTGDQSFKDIYVEGTRLVDKEGNPIMLDALPQKPKMQKMVALPQAKGGGALTKKKATTALVRFSKGAYQKPTNLQGTVKGYAAYSMVCTHEGCVVSGELGGQLYCPCHASKFDPTRGSRVTGGPAPRPLPQLPLGVSKKKREIIVATGPFEGPIGPE